MEGELKELRRQYELLHEENVYMKEELERHDGIVMGLRSQVYLKDERIKKFDKERDRLTTTHTKRVTRMENKHKEEMDALHAELGTLKHDNVLLKATADRADELAAKVATLKELNATLLSSVKKLKQLQIELDKKDADREALLQSQHRMLSEEAQRYERVMVLQNGQELVNQSLKEQLEKSQVQNAILLAAIVNPDLKRIVQECADLNVENKDLRKQVERVSSDRQTLHNFIFSGNAKSKRIVL